MSKIGITGGLTTALVEMLANNDDIQPGSAPGYQLCKTIYEYHPLGAKLVEKPLEIAQSQPREISVPDSPETRVKEAFEQEWVRMGCSTHIFSIMKLARTYGVASLAVMEEGVPVGDPLNYENLYKSNLSINIYDPMNTAGSLVLNQNPMAIDFQHVTEIAVNGTAFHRSRSLTMMNEQPMYISYTASGFGFVGRSVYQRSLYPLKSFLQTTVTDDLVARKAGALVAKIKQPGSIINNAMMKLFAPKRQVVKEAENGGVISIGTEEDIESINLQNLEGPLTVARKNILENVASASGMPAKMLTEETFAEGFGEGTEDAKAVARYIDRVREQMQPLYDFFDRIVMYRAWNPNFYKIIQSEYKEYKQMPYNQAFYKWKNSFTSKWPSLLTEPDSELVKVDEVRLRAVLAWLQLMLPQSDPDNKARMIEWAVDNFNSLKFLFDTPLVLDYEELANHEPEPQMGAMQGGPPGQKPPGQNPQMGGGGGMGGKAGMGGMGMTMGGMGGRSAANDAIDAFEKAVDKMLEGKNRAPLRLVKSER
jgi:hypothetical protein